MKKTESSTSMKGIGLKTIIFILLILVQKMAFSQVIAISSDDNRTIQVPVVFHVVQQAGKSQDVHATVTEEKLKQEIKDLNANYSANNDMSALDESFRTVIGNPNIQFHLSDADSKGYLIRYNIGKNDQFDPDFFDHSKVLHIVIGDMLSSSNVLLDQGKNNPTHVKISYKLVGNQSNTVTHELGHYFGLWHVWGPSNCKRIKFHKRTDYIPDTPRQKNCTDVSRTQPCPPAKKAKKPNYNNFMDYSACRCFFTKDQAQTMRNKIITNTDYFKN